MTRDVLLHRPGIVPYRDAWRWQQETAAAVSAGAPEALTILQHPPVYTLGRRARPENLLVDRDTLAKRGAEVVQTDRGGDITFHGPGQLVAYPILNLRARNLAPADYVRLLEETMLLTVQRFGITADRQPGRPGIWASGAKLGAVGVRVQNGVSMHGLALNVDVDLSWFDAIVPCGLTGITLSSIQRLLTPAPSMTDVEDAFLTAFVAVFASTPIASRGDSVSNQLPVRNPFVLSLSKDGNLYTPPTVISPSPPVGRGLGGGGTPEPVHGR